MKILLLPVVLAAFFVGLWLFLRRAYPRRKRPAGPPATTASLGRIRRNRDTPDRLKERA